MDKFIQKLNFDLATDQRILQLLVTMTISKANGTL